MDDDVVVVGVVFNVFLFVFGRGVWVFVVVVRIVVVEMDVFIFVGDVVVFVGVWGVVWGWGVVVGWWWGVVGVVWEWGVDRGDGRDGSVKVGDDVFGVVVVDVGGSKVVGEFIFVKVVV